MFYTQLEVAKKGFVTDAMKIVAEKEQISVERIRELVSLGQVVIPCNKNYMCIDPEGTGKALRTKINVNLGTSWDVTKFHSMY
ncbi:phosphomethylpyrimidine synthase ThiC [Veillonella atypica]|uniref:phosphomethylpyrimidine synthase ThiC n=1 Tax=Veillonella atypica TaxID=39777 RepID=UPI002174FE8F|nr:phosphomethylpyrimidine synthase ThiC [Veillonella atypica]